jgi:hypothetical protein
MTRNDPLNPFQRRFLSIRKTSASTIQAELIGVIHGSLRDRDDPDDLATLIIIEFRFQPLKSSRRIRSANIKFQFTDADSESETGSKPEVYKIAPQGPYELVRKAIY